MKYLSYLAILSFLCLIVGCHKPKPKNPSKPYYPMDAGFKNTFLQGGEGSTWIYTDSAGTIYDTVTLVQVGHGGGSVDASYEGESYSTEYNATNCKSYFTTLKTGHSTSPEETYYTYEMATNTGGEFDVSLRNGVYTPETKVVKMDSFTIHGVTYHHVVKLLGGGYYNQVVIDPSIGIIYKKAWSSRPVMGHKEFYLKNYSLK